MPYWEPQLGPQLKAVTCPVDFVFFGGSRGGGKSDALIGRQLSGADQYSNHWNGLIIRRKYKDFRELRRRWDELITSGLPAERTGGEQQTNYLNFKNGAIVTMPAINQLQQVNDFVGHQYCVAEGTPIIMGDRSFKNIEKVLPGEYVLTLEGPRKVLKTMAPRDELCVRVVNPFGYQIHPVEHPVFSAFGWQSYASILGIDSKDIEGIPQAFRTLPSVATLAVVSRQISDQYLFSETRPNLFHKLYKSDPLCLELSKDLLRECLDQQRQPGPFRSLLDHAFLHYFYGGGAYGRIDFQRFRDYLLNYLSCRCLCDEQPLDQTKIVSRRIPLQSYAALPSLLRYMLDVLDNTQEYIPAGVLSYEHPYSGMEKPVTEGNFFFPCVMSFVGEYKVHDLTIEKANHYITGNTGLVNKNTEIAIDECTTFPFFTQMIDKLKGSNRSPHGVPCRMFGTGNPGGPGHNAVKEYFKLGSGGVTPETVMYHDLGGGYRESRIFIPSFLDDNKILCQNDPLYVARLKSISDPALRKAWIDGDWDVFIGQAFNFVPQYHVLQPFRVPPTAPIYTTFDWGFGKPFSWGWWFIDNDGRVIRFAEWYGSTGVPDEGLRLSDSEIAKGVKEREDHMQIDPHNIQVRFAGPDCFAKKPNYEGGGQGPSTADQFAKEGVYIVPGDPRRELKIRQFRERLLIKRDSDGNVIDRPMMQVFATCKDFIRTIPSLCMDELKPEDIDTDQEDHIYDEACHICMARPLNELSNVATRTSLAAKVEAHVTGKSKLPPVLQQPSTGNRYLPLD